MKEININISGSGENQSFTDIFQCDECIFNNRGCSDSLGMVPDCLFATRLARNVRRSCAVYNMSDQKLEIEMLQSHEQSFEQIKSILQTTKDIYRRKTR